MRVEVSSKELDPAQRDDLSLAVLSRPKPLAFFLLPLETFTGVEHSGQAQCQEIGTFELTEGL